MKVEEMWEEYRKINPSANHYEAWEYGSDNPDLLAELTLKGIKTSTASLYRFYEVENESLPLVDDYNVIYDSKGQAVCVTQTKKVTLKPFREVEADHAYKEGEGDRSLAYWRKVHQEVFTKELKEEINEEFSEDMVVVLEEFKVVYPLAAGSCSE